jgi:hypothetical protein
MHHVQTAVHPIDQEQPMAHHVDEFATVAAVTADAPSALSFPAGVVRRCDELPA